MLLSLVGKESDRRNREELVSPHHPLALLLSEGYLAQSDGACCWTRRMLIVGKPYRILELGVYKTGCSS